MKSISTEVNFGEFDFAKLCLNVFLSVKNRNVSAYVFAHYAFVTLDNLVWLLYYVSLLVYFNWILLLFIIFSHEWQYDLQGYSSWRFAAIKMSQYWLQNVRFCAAVIVSEGWTKKTRSFHQVQLKSFLSSLTNLFKVIVDKVKVIVIIIILVQVHSDIFIIVLYHRQSGIQFTEIRVIIFI